MAVASGLGHGLGCVHCCSRLAGLLGTFLFDGGSGTHEYSFEVPMAAVKLYRKNYVQSVSALRQKHPDGLCRF